MNEKEMLIRYIEGLEKGREIEKDFISCLEKSFKRNFIITMISMISLIIIVCAFLFYLYQYDFTTEVTTTTTVEQDAGLGSANFIGGDGDISHGKAENN